MIDLSGILTIKGKKQIGYGRLGGDGILSGSLVFNTLNDTVRMWEHFSLFISYYLNHRRCFDHF